MKILRLLTLAGVLFIFAYGCDDEFGDIDWKWQKYELIAPLLVTDIQIENVTDFHQVSHESELEGSSVGFPPGTYPFIPAFEYSQQIHMGEFIISDHFSEIEMQLVDIGLRVDNQFPITIGGETEIAVYERGTNIVVHRFPIGQDVPPNENILVDNAFQNIQFSGDVEWYLERFQSPGSEEPVTFTEDDYARFSLEYFFIDITSATVQNNADYLVLDTVRFNAFQDMDDAPDQADRVEGDIRIFIENHFPLDIRLQFVFLDKDMNVLDSLFDGDVIEIDPAETNNNTGEVLDWIDREAVIPISSDKWDRIRRSRHISTRVRVRTTHLEDPARILSENSRLTFQLVGDLIVNPE